MAGYSFVVAGFCYADLGGSSGRSQQSSPTRATPRGHHGASQCHRRQGQRPGGVTFVQRAGFSPDLNPDLQADPAVIAPARPAALTAGRESYPSVGGRGSVESKLRPLLRGIHSLM